MKVITVLTRKGGAGKTTLLRSLVSAATSEGKKCLALDGDPQKALLRWSLRLGYKNPLLEVKDLQDPESLEAETDGAWEEGTTDYVFVDTLGAAGEWADTLAAFSDHLVCPMMLTETDLEITIDTFNWYCGLRERTENPEDLPSFHVVLSRVPSKPSNTMAAVAEKAVQLFPVIHETFMERKQHADSDSEGLLQDVAESKRNNPNHIIKTHAKYYLEAIEEAKAILSGLIGGQS